MAAALNRRVWRRRPSREEWEGTAGQGRRQGERNKGQRSKGTATRGNGSRSKNTIHSGQSEERTKGKSGPFISACIRRACMHGCITIQWPLLNVVLVVVEREGG